MGAAEHVAAAATASDFYWLWGSGEDMLVDNNSSNSSDNSSSNHVNMSEIRMKMAHQNHACKPSFLHGGLVWLPDSQENPFGRDPTIVLQNCQQKEEGPIP